MRLAIVGSQDYPNLDEVREFVRSQPSDTVIITGGAIGVDKVAEEEAEGLCMQVVIFKPNWQKYGRAAGPIRNRLIVDDCDQLQAFWYGDSPGTRSSIAIAKNAGKLLGVRRILKQGIQGDLFSNE